MTNTTQNLRRTALFAVSGFTLTAPAFATEQLPHSNLDTADIGSSGDHASVRKPADQAQSYAAALKDAYAGIEICQNPALAALAANIAQLAKH